MNKVIIYDILYQPINQYQNDIQNIIEIQGFELGWSTSPSSVRDQNKMALPF